MITNNDKAVQEWSMMIDALLMMLIQESKTNAEIRDYMRREDKNMEDCAKYVYNKAKEIGQGQKAICLPDSKVLELAIEYFTTDNVEEDERDAE